MAMEVVSSGVACALDSGLLSVTCVSPHVIRVRRTQNDSFSETATGICLPQTSPAPQVDVKDDKTQISIQTGKISVEIDKSTGALCFLDDSGSEFLSFSGNSSEFEPIEIKELEFDLSTAAETETVDGGRIEADIVEAGRVKPGWQVRQNFVWQPGEALYGLGSHEEDVLNLRGTMQYLYQQNMKAVVPVIVSSRGYGILFNVTCEMEFHDDDAGSFVKLDAVDELDYYVIYGPEFDSIVSGYRELTGRVPMLPRWSFGYCQSKERYQTQEELVEVVEEYRKRKLPLDLIIQDWKYWTQGWGIKSFDPSRYPDPSAMCERIHELNAHVMISIWPTVKGDDEAYDMQQRGYMLNDMATYDAYSDAARKAYWDYAENLFRHGIDGWWCDCTEPVEADWCGSTKLSPEQRRSINTQRQQVVLGRERVASYSLLHSQGIYENQRHCSGKRVINLTRSAYAGQQRYATVTWSGDVAARWEVLAQQIPSGLGFAATGCPYWTNDIGGFFVGKDPDTKLNRWFWNGQFDNGCDDLGYREFYTRWFQYGSFLPMFRSHGTDTPRELWQFGNPGDLFYDSLVKYLHLRYQLMPYIYSLAGRTTQEHYTMMRLLAFDFREDPQALDIKTQYMFGSALMVCPITRPMYYDPGSQPIVNDDKSRKVYLPAGAEWYDFWTDARVEGGQTIDADAPIETMPLYVRAGSIIPMGPEVQYTDEKLDAEWTIHIYPGADASFRVYEDAGDGYGYEASEFASWHLNWDDASRVLTVGERSGSFPGMVRSRLLALVLHAGGTPYCIKNVIYSGQPLAIECQY